MEDIPPPAGFKDYNEWLKASKEKSDCKRVQLFLTR